MFKIVIIDDHQIVSLGISKMISKIPECEVVGTYVNGLDFLKVLNENDKPDLVFVDISMPNISGLNLLAKIKESYSSINVVMLSMHNDRNYIIEAIKSGANGYLTKDSDEFEFVLCINHIRKSKNYFSPKISKQLRMGVDNDNDVKITQKEKLIIRHIINGLTSEEIGGIESISKRTVEAHRYNVMKKLNAVNSVDLIRKVIEADIDLFND